MVSVLSRDWREAVWRQRTSLSYSASSQKTPKPTGSWKKQVRILPQSLWREDGTPNSMISDFGPPDLRKNKALLLGTTKERNAAPHPPRRSEARRDEPGEGLQAGGSPRQGSRRSLPAQTSPGTLPRLSHDALGFRCPRSSSLVLNVCGPRI